MNMLTKFDLFCLINVANFQSGLLRKNLILSANDFEAFNKYKNGIPLLIPANQNIFDFENRDVFEIERKKLVTNIYGMADFNYVGFKHAFPGNLFLQNFKVKNQFEDCLDKLVKQNLGVVASIKELKLRCKKIGAFQTRNIPHLGHEKIISKLLEVCDHVVINPVIGPKKKGDIKLNVLQKIFEHLIHKQYGSKISFLPIYSNMYYAGPIEALHHSILRERLGFDYFTVGRDHAGASKKYQEDAAANLIDKSKDQLSIDVMCHLGAVYCSICKDVVLVNECNHEKRCLTDISGSDFRLSISKKVQYKYASRLIQDFLLEKDMELFE